ncbi:MAG: hypothetical protein KAT28_05690 [Candidatus Aenigmarchaeota archaeon]|nr:hypothetical protein [Candidatus Aenigmarchaeota archaeon]
MDWKEFFKLTIGKIILFLVLMVGINYTIISETYPPDGSDILAGVPLAFYPIKNSVLDSIDIPHITFSYENFIIDILFWYGVSGILFFLYNKFISKTKCGGGTLRSVSSRL